MFDTINVATLLSYWNTYKGNNYASGMRLYKALFPETKQIGNILKFVKGKGGKQVALAASALNASPVKMPVGSITSMKDNLFIFRSTKEIDEEFVYEYQNALNWNSAMGAESLANVEKQILDDLVELPEGAEIIADAMACQLLSSGIVTISHKNVSRSVDYGLDNSQKETLLGTSKWSDTTNARPIADIQRWQDVVERSDLSQGERPMRAVCTIKTLNYIMDNSAVIADFSRNYGTGQTITRADIINYINKKTGVMLEVYDKSYKIDANTTVKVFPDEIFTLLPASTIGKTVCSATPEEMARQSIEDFGTFGDANAFSMSASTETDGAVTKSFKASAMMLPSAENVSKIFIGTVHS